MKKRKMRVHKRLKKFVEKEYTDTVTYECPVNGLITEEVFGIKLKSLYKIPNNIWVLDILDKKED
jgi:hypothetical protein